MEEGGLNGLAHEIHAIAVGKGWWPEDPKSRNFAEVLALIHSEVSEVLEDWRDGKPIDQISYTLVGSLPPEFPYAVTVVGKGEQYLVKPDTGGPVQTFTREQFLNLLRIWKVPVKPDGIPIELADIIIRVLDVCAAHDIDIQRAIAEKMDFNRTRPERHGGKRA